MAASKKRRKSGSERGRDEQRREDTPRYHGGDWAKVDRERPPEGPIPSGNPDRRRNKRG
jgi:hypothetical protein